MEASRILLVDDRPENLLALEAILHGLGHDLVSVKSGEEALKRLLSEDFALILLDVAMPGMDGFETATHIKQRERTRDIPILFLTAMDTDAHQAFRGYAAGAVDYIPKPFDPWVLRAKVSVFVELHERRRTLAARSDELRHQLAVHHSASVDRLISEAANAVSLAQLLADETVEPDLVKALTGAADAIAALRDALATGAGGPLP